MDVIREKNDGDVSKSVSKKRKNSEMSDVGGEVLLNEGIKKKVKTKVLDDISKGVSDVVVSTDVDSSSSKEKDTVNRINVNVQEGNERREGKIKKVKTGDGEGVKKKKKYKEKLQIAEFDFSVGDADSIVNQTNHEVTETVDLVESKKRKKKDGKALGATFTEKAKDCHLDSIDYREDSESGGDKINEKSVRSMMKEEANTENTQSVKEKKRKKKKNDDLGACGEPREKIHVTSTRGSEKSRDQCSTKENSPRPKSQTDAKAGISKDNGRNENAASSENSHHSKKLKKVKFSEYVEVFPLEKDKGKKRLEKDKGKKRLEKDKGKKRLEKDKGKKRLEKDKGKKRLEKDSEDKRVENGSEEKEIVDDGLIKGKRFSKEEDEIIQNAVFKYIDVHHLGEEGLEMILNCKSYPELKYCWKEIGEALPRRPHMAVYYRAHILFERSDSRKWTEEEIELVKKFHAKYGPDWKTLGVELGKHRIHVKDAWRRIKLPNLKKGNWSQEEYQKLFSLVNMDLSMKAFTEKKLKYGMLRDNISWEGISDELSTRSNASCCHKWYQQLTSPMVEEGKWANCDDYRLLIALSDVDAACEEEVDWDNLLEHRSGNLCRKRWNQMVRHIGENGNKLFSDQVEILSQRYCPDLLEVREEYDNRPAID